MSTATTTTTNARGSAIPPGVLGTTLLDLSLAVEWKQLRLFPLRNTPYTAIIGHRRATDPLRAVLPLPLHTSSLTPPVLKAVFESLSNVTLSNLPGPMEPLVPDLADLRLELKAAKTTETADGEITPEPEAAVAPSRTPAEDSASSSADALPPPLTFDPDTLYMAIVATDSTVVYYKLSRGIKKPADIPDE